MTHPSLPNGFSRDFSEAPEGEYANGWVTNFRGEFEPFPFVRKGDEIWIAPGTSYPVGTPELLCWCPIPAPGDAILKELAEGK